MILGFGSLRFAISHELFARVREIFAMGHDLFARGLERASWPMANHSWLMANLCGGRQNPPATNREPRIICHGPRRSSRFIIVYDKEV